jgi:hypothetical protein
MLRKKNLSPLRQYLHLVDTNLVIFDDKLGLEDVALGEETPLVLLLEPVQGGLAALLLGLHLGLARDSLMRLFKEKTVTQ